MRLILSIAHASSPHHDYHQLHIAAISSQRYLASSSPMIAQVDYVSQSKHYLLARRRIEVAQYPLRLHRHRLLLRGWLGLSGEWPLPPEWHYLVRTSRLYGSDLRRLPQLLRQKRLRGLWRSQSLWTKQLVLRWSSRDRRCW